MKDILEQLEERRQAARLGGGQARIDDVAARFGSEVAAIVADLSDSLVDTEAMRAIAFGDG